jgi:hypothetical protein
MRKLLLVVLALFVATSAFASSPVVRFGQIGTGIATVTTPGTAVQLSSTSVPCSVVYMTAVYRADSVGIMLVSHDNASMWVGASNVSAGGADTTITATNRRGHLLTSHDVMELPVADLNMVYIDSLHSQDSVSYTYLN